jgi:hypothetical protein
MLLPPFQFGDGGGPGGWRIFFDPELHLGDDIVVPDLAGWRLDRMPTPTTATFVTFASDWTDGSQPKRTAQAAILRGLEVPLRAHA